MLSELDELFPVKTRRILASIGFWVCGIAIDRQIKLVGLNTRKPPRWEFLLPLILLVPISLRFSTLLGKVRVRLLCQVSVMITSDDLSDTEDLMD